MSKYKATVKFAWHVHHNVLLEPLTETLKKRIAYIKKHKPEDEIATRLRLLKPVVGGLPTAVAEAWKSYNKARKAYEAAWKSYIEPWKAYIEARKARDKALKIHEAEILALHAIECPNCPWDKEQHTIFPEVEHAVNPKTH